MTEKKIGDVAHFYAKVGVAGIEITDGELRVGDKIRVKGHTSDFTQTVGSIQIEHDEVEVAKPGDSVGVKVGERAREHDQVFKVTED